MKPLDVYSTFDIDIVKARGCDLWDSFGNKYLDLYGGHAVISIGHSHPVYLKALSEQIRKIGFYSNAIKMPLQEELAFKLGELSGYTDYNLFLCNSGAEANENAFKLASFNNKRKKIIAFKGSFHGRTSLAVAATDNPSIVSPVNQNAQVVFLPLNDMEAFDAVAGDDVCAVIIEGIQGVGGVIIPDPDFLKHIERRCLKYGIILILDEVQSGYGRSGKFFAHQYAGIRPQLITVAKGMGNGFPIAGVLVSPDLKVHKEMLGTTFGGNYLACAAAIAVLDVIRDENLIGNAANLGVYLGEKLSHFTGIRDLRIRGLMAGIELEEPCAEIRRQLLFVHRIFTGSSADKNTIRLLPSLAISNREIDLFIHALSPMLIKEDEIFYNSK
ncbi:MAG: aminotransferase class III-fold pyridoxal phosphate-dependent enzyme [Bacteroidetes bacterium]|nr:aminotransferase class III-fold pyridoxal phosphate-dependent enzyme [Bacteroidota bacterium]